MGMICVYENENKQAILEALIQKVMEEYREHSVFLEKDWEYVFELTEPGFIVI